MSAALSLFDLHAQDDEHRRPKCRDGRQALQEAIGEMAKTFVYEPLPGEVRAVVIAAW